MSKMPFSHEESFDLLPWFVTGTLSDAEAEGVKGHVRTCLVCRRELEAQQRISDLVADADMVPLTPYRSFRALMARVDARETGQQKRGPPRWLAWTSSPLPVAAGLAALMLIGIYIIVFGNLRDREPAYRTLSQDTEVLPGGAPLLQLIFAEPVQHTEALRIVSELGAEIVAGPRAAGAYTIQVEEDKADAVLETLRRDPRVRFAEPTQIGPRSD